MNISWQSLQLLSNDIHYLIFLYDESQINIINNEYKLTTIATFVKWYSLFNIFYDESQMNIINNEYKLTTIVTFVKWYSLFNIFYDESQMNIINNEYKLTTIATFVKWYSLFNISSWWISNEYYKQWI